MAGGLTWRHDANFESYLFVGESLCVIVRDEFGRRDDGSKNLAEQYGEVVIQASEKEFSSRHWEPLTSCGEGMMSYKHSQSGDRVIVKVVNWPLPDGDEKKGIIVHAGDHKAYMKFLKVLMNAVGKEKKKKKRG
jgi:hypothetical protein